MAKNKKLMKSLASVADGASSVLATFVLKHNPNADVAALRSGVLELSASVLANTQVSVIASSEARGLTEYCQASDAIALAHSIFKSGDRQTGIQMMINAFALPDCDELMVALAEINDESSPMLDDDRIGGEDDESEDVLNPGSTIAAADENSDSDNSDGEQADGGSDSNAAVATDLGEPTDTDPESDPEIEGIIASALEDFDNNYSDASDAENSDNVTAAADDEDNSDNEDSDGNSVTAEDALYNEPSAGDNGVLDDEESMFDTGSLNGLGGGDDFEDTDPLESVFASTTDLRVIAAANKLSMSGSKEDRKRAAQVVKEMNRRAA